MFSRYLFDLTAILGKQGADNQPSDKTLPPG